MSRLLWSGSLFGVTLLCATALFLPDFLFANGMSHYSDTITNSAPGTATNHHLSFVLEKDIAASAYIDITPPDGFEIKNEATFASLRNVELSENGILRSVALTPSGSDDSVTITPGTPGTIRYTFNSSTGLTKGSQIDIMIGNQTTRSNHYSETFDAVSQSTTTVQEDIKPIVNSTQPGTYSLQVDIHDGLDVYSDGFVFVIIEGVGVGPVDTTETVPPLRFNGAPTGTLPGTTASVEISIETDEFSMCRYSLSPNVSYDSMTESLSTSFNIFHSKVVGVSANSVQRFYVRCIDDEHNKNIDDYVILFIVSARPTGVSNTTGSTSGNGTGSGNDGTGSGNGGGGTTGGANGQAPTTGGQSGGGGSGGGGGGGSGGNTGSGSGGGFEATPGPYQSGDAQVSISGFTAPRNTVTALVDGKIVQTVSSDGNGAFSVTIAAIARGAYTFGIYSTDSTKVKSATFSTSFTVTGARESALTNILIAPTVLATPDPVNPGQVLTLSGYAIPNAVINLENMKDGSAPSLKQFTSQSNANGAWTTTLDTTGFPSGTYKARAKATMTTGAVTNFSTYTLYGVGQSAIKTLNSDLNRDGKVNLTDFSILLFWWNSNGGTSDPSADINGDAKVSLTDFSILLFNWTG